MTSPIRLLIAGYCAKRPGGVETFIRNIAFGLPKDQFHVCVLSFDCASQKVREAFEEKGVRFFSPADEFFPKKRERDIRQVVDQFGPVDIIHCNGVTNSWRWLKGAAELEIPVRIFHGHNPIQKFGGFFREIYIRNYTIPLLSHYATRCIFCSEYVMNQWVRLRSKETIPCSVNHCGIDFSMFNRPRVNLRPSLGIPEDALVFGQIGRFTLQKNHEFLINIFKEVAAKEPRAHFLLVGTGQRESRVRRLIERLGLINRFTLTGRRSDIPDLLAVMNVFVLPSFFEGLPLVSVEAQAAGVPSLCSTGISMETCLVPGMIDCLSLNASPEKWADRAISIAKEKFPPYHECLKIVQESSFELSKVTQSFADFYRNCLAGVEGKKNDGSGKRNECVV